MLLNRKSGAKNSGFFLRGCRGNKFSSHRVQIQATVISSARQRHLLKTGDCGGARNLPKLIQIDFN